MTAADSPLSAEGAQLLRNARRIVVKVGSSLVTNEGRGLDEAAIGHWCRQLAALASQLRQRLGAQPSARVRIAPRYQMGLEKDVMVERRGQALVGALVAAGVPASRIQVETDITGRRDAGGRRSRVELLLIR